MKQNKKCSFTKNDVPLWLVPRYVCSRVSKGPDFRIFKDFSILHIRFSRIGRDKFGLFFPRPSLFSAAAASFPSFVFEKLVKKMKEKTLDESLLFLDLRFMRR